MGQTKAEFGRMHNFVELGLFDKLFYQAVAIAGKIEENTGRLRYGEEAWFLILNFLNNWKLV